MSGAIADLEQQGYRFRLEGDQVMVSGWDGLIEPDELLRIRERKTEILIALRVQAFVELVRAIGASKHQILLPRKEIESLLDADDIRELFNIARAERRAWAELLASRLCKARLNQ